MTSNYNSVQTASAGRLLAKKVFGQISGGVARTSCDSALAKLVCDSGMQSKELSQGQVSDIGRSECWSDRARVFVNLSHFRSHAGETYVSAELMRRRWLAATTARGSRLLDILVLCSAQRHPGVRSLLYSTAGASWFSFSTSGSSSVPLPSIRLLNSTSSCR